MKAVTFTNSKKPKLISAVMGANLAACAHQDKDIREQYLDIKESASANAGQNADKDVILIIP